MNPELSNDALGLTPAQRDLMARLLRDELGLRPERETVIERPAEGVPLSFAQQRLWFFDQLAPGNPVYNIPATLRLRGPLDVGALERTLRLILSRHEALRTVFTTVNGRPVQRPLSATEIEWTLPRMDLSGAGPLATRLTAARELSRQLARQPFDLQSGCLLRAAVVRLADDDHLALFCLHHIAGDGWSMGVFVREVAAGYAAYREGREPALPPLPLQYADVALEQRQRLQGPELTRQLAWWQAQLAEAPLLELLTDRPRPSVPGFRGERVNWDVGAKLTAGLRRVASEEQATLFMVLLAAWQVVLGKWAGQTDVVVGAPIANRTRAEVEGLIGFFVNTLALRGRWTNREPFRALVRRTQETTLGAYAHQDVPFEAVVEALHPARQANRHPVFQVVFALQNAVRDTLVLPGLHVEPVPMALETTRFDFEMHVWEQDRDLRLHLVYDADLYSPDTAARLLLHYASCLEQIAQDPDRRIECLSLMSADDVERLHVWQRSTLPASERIDVRFERQVASTPEAIAIVDGTREWSYRRLGEEADAFAAMLQHAGVRPGDRVGIALGRSAELVAALIGTLKAGAAYVPLDASQPRLRLASHIGQAGLSAVICDPAQAAHFDVTEVRLLHPPPPECGESMTPLPEPRDPAALAYILFTSGSTGEPNPVAVPHRAVTRLLENDFATFGLGEVMLLHSPISFDASTLEIWGSLLTGARLVVLPPFPHSLEELAQVLVTRGISTLWLTAGLFHQLVDGHLESLVAVRQLMAGGDVLQPAHVTRFLSRTSGTLVNGYGPTETTVFAACHRMAAGAEADHRVPIGRAVPGTQIFVLDESFRPVPAGVPGEICIAGSGLAWGYWGQPALSAERFIPHPLANNPGERLYRSGDRGRWRPDGALEFLGRIDRQVKIRGFRVEPGEVERVLQQHPAVDAAVVTVDVDGTGNRSIAAFVTVRERTASAPLATDVEADAAGDWRALDEETLRGDRSATAAVPTGSEPPRKGEHRAAERLRDYVRGRLPAYMVPSRVTVLDRLPLNANGKVDRNALAAIPRAGRAATGESEQPRTAVEWVLAEIWRALLGVESVGMHDDFFALGGHSLLATQVVSQIRVRYGYSLPLRTVFEAPTIAGLAKHVTNALTSAYEDIASALPPVSRPAEGAPLSFAQQRLWFFDQLAPGNPVYNIPATLRLRGPLDVAALERALRMILARHEALRTVFTTVEGQPVQRPVPATDVAWTLALTDLSGEGAPEARLAAARELSRRHARQPFDLRSGCLLRAAVVRLADDDHLVLFCLHHIAGDGWSMGVLVREVAAGYAAYRDGSEPALPALPLQYADVALEQRHRLQGPELARQLAWWREQLTNAPELELPADRARPTTPTFHGARVSWEVGAEVTADLRRVAGQEQATLFMVLLAAWQVVLGKWAGQPDVVVGAPIANRTRAEVEGLIGFFVNTLALRGRWTNREPFRALLRRTRETTLGAYAHQDLPFEALVEALHPARQANRNPVFQVAFALQNASRDTLALPDLHVESVSDDGATSKFDITLMMSERHGGLFATLEYSTELFDHATIERLRDHFDDVLRQVARNPDGRIRDVRLPAAPVPPRLGADTSAPLPIRRFEQQVRRHPHSVAVVDGTSQWTYAELNEHADRIARLGRDAGVGTEDRVGLFLERSVDLVAATLAVHKMGAAYVPLDPESPLERLQYICNDARPSLVLTTSTAAGRLPRLDCSILRVDEERSNSASGTPGEGSGYLDAASAAYYIYTSGSTGKPKGVCVTHGNVARLLDRTAHWFAFSERAVWTLFHSFAFDFSVWEFWGALAYGGRLVVVPHAVSRDPAELHRWVRTEGVTVLNQTPTAFRGFMRADESAGTPPLDLRYVIFGGESLDPRALAGWFERRGDERPTLVNMYGITETTVHVTYRALTQKDAAGSASVIGDTIPDLTAYVVDSSGHLAPICAPGEIFVAGEGLARGYAQNPALTAERFVPEPFSRIAGARMYRSGDRARRLPSGELEYLGRLDQQVKIRGFRIEPGEIEAALAEHPGVREAIVVARGNAAERRLFAYYIPVDNALPAGDLRAFAATRLPEYMLPTAVMAIRRVPTNINGKLDLDALPEPAFGDVRTGRAMAPPSGPVETALVEIWSDVLGVPLVGIEDNFFELGGDSIRALEVRARAEARGIQFSLQQLFQMPVIAQLAAAAAVKPDVAVMPQVREPFRLLAATDRARLPDDVEDAWPLSRLQSGMIFHSELGRDTAVYHDVFSYHLGMPFDRAALREAVRRVMDRHPVLRTSFALDAFGEPVQLVHREVEFDVDVTDWRALPEAEQTARLERWLAGERHHAFDWARAPLFRIYLHQRSDESFQFTFSLHHAILDGWSVASFLTELFETYRTLRDGGTEERPALKAAYADFIRLERLALKSEACRQFWARELSGAVAETIPRLGAPMASSPRTVASHNVGLDERLSEALHRAAAADGVPIKSLLLAAHVHVLSILAGRADIVTGVVSHGRPEVPDGEKILGLFLNTLPFRYPCRRESWRELAVHVFAHEREALPHRWYPMSQMRKDVNRAQLFDTVFNFIHFHVLQRIEQDDHTRTLDANVFEETNFDFVADFSQSLSTQQLHLTLRYSSAAFDPSRVAAIADLYRHALSQAAADVDAPVRGADTLPPAQMTQLRAWSSPPREPVGQSMVVPAIRAQRDRSPEAIAVIAGNETLTYGELVERAGALAAQIVSAGVEGGRRVGVCLQRSSDLVVAIVAVLQAGGAYVALDAEYPGERLRFMAEDAGISLALVDAPGEAALHSCAMTLLPATAWSRHGVDLEPHAVVPEQAAYVLYTSGSTGTPKGVVVTHAALANHMAWLLERFEFGADDRTLLKTPISFDASVWEYLAPLMSGGTLVVAPAGAHRDPAKLVECINAHAVTVLQTVPSLLRALLDEPRFGTCVSLRHFFCGGEALAPDLRDALWGVLPDVALHNLYGPTEATIDATSYSCERGDSGTVPIGMPIRGLDAFVLDELGEPAPVGTPGGLFLGGRGLARGYVNRPAETALRFIPHPFATVAGSRLYRTGDRARWLPSGSLEYLGRTDGQAKLHGYRIEVGEIEAQLATHASVRQAVVTMRREGDRDLLVAYVRPVTGADVAAGQLNEHLRHTLPGYMIPARFVTLADWPLAPNGKIDRRALSHIEAEEPAVRASVTGDMTVVQREVLGVCRDLLAAGEAGLDDNFFALGGDSILALQLLSRLRRRFDLRLELQQLLDARDIRAVAALFAAQTQPAAAPSMLREEHRSLLVDLRPGRGDVSLFLVHPFGGSAFLYRDLALRMPPEVRVVGIQAQGFDGVDRPLSSVAEMARLYLALLRERVPHGPYLLAGHSFGGVLAYEMACLLGASGIRVPLVAMIDSGPPHQLTLQDSSTSVEYLAVLTGIRPEEYLTGGAHSDEHQLHALLDGLRRANKLPAGFDPSHLQTLLPLWKAHARAIREYRPTPSEVTVDFFRARERHRGEDRHPEAFWSQAARGGVRVSVAGGGHYTMLMPPHVDALAEDLSSLVSETLHASPGSPHFK